MQKNDFTQEEGEGSGLESNYLPPAPTPLDEVDRGSVENLFDKVFFDKRLNSLYASYS